MKTWIRLRLIRLGWLKCYHLNCSSSSFRENDGTLMLITDCPDCGYHDFGHVHDS